MPDQPVATLERHRLARLHALAVLDSAPEPLFDALVAAAATLVGVPIALVSLVDRDRQWFKANLGLEGVRETPREVAFCAQAIQQDDLLEVPDALQDQRFADNPLVQGSPDIRFYAGAPIRLKDGLCMGTLCVMDRQPRTLDDRQRSILRHLADAAAEALDLRQAARACVQAQLNEVRLARQLAEDHARLARTLEAAGAGTWQWQLADDLVRLDGQALHLLGRPARERVRPLGHCLARVHPDDQVALRAALVRMRVEAGQGVQVEVRIARPDGATVWLMVRGGLAAPGEAAASGDEPLAVGTLVDVTRRKQAELALAEQAAEQHALYRRTPAMLHSIDPEGRLIAVSDAWLQRLGYRREQVIGRPSTDFMTPDSRRHAREVVQPEFFRQGRCDRIGYQMVRADGEVIDVELSAVLERAADGTGRWSVAVLEDVTARHRAERRLQASEALLRRTGRLAAVGGWEESLADGSLHCADPLYPLYGLPPGSPMDRVRLLAAYPPEARALLQPALERLRREGRPFDLELPFDTPDRGRRWVRVVGALEREGPGPGWLVGAVQDITERLATERALAESHELMRVTLRSIGDAVITTDERGRVQWFNPAAERMTGWLDAEARGKPLAQVFHILDEETRRVAPNPVAECLAQRRVVSLSRDTVLVSRDGTERGIEDSAAPIHSEAGELIGAVLVFHDVTEQRALSREMTRRARHDQLTGLLNRGEFEHRLQRLLDKAAEDGGHHALMYLDLDQFKLVNDACGHTAGDQLLRQIADLLRDTVRSRDAVARLGGDEFAVLLEHCPPADAQTVGQKICDRLEEFRFLHDGRRFRVGASIGLVTVDQRWRDRASLVQAADLACLAAKEAGRNRVHVWFDSDEALQRRSGESQWASRLEQALEDSRFELYAQRITPLRQPDAGLHCELLLRLPGESGEVIAPAAFMPAAERFHIASRIDRWVLQRTLGWMAGLGDRLGQLGMVAINLSGQSVGDRAFHRFAVEQLRASGLDLRKLCVEITETVAITHLGDAAAFIDQVRALGVKVALDDFGAGASSFAYLKSLPIDLLKIDGQFIRDMVSDPLDSAAVRCFQEVAEVLGLATVAECVEDDAVLQALRHVGVDHAQGFLMHRPAPLDQLLPSRQAQPLH